MKKLLLALTILLASAIWSYAADFSLIESMKKIPGAHVGTMYSIKYKNFDVLASWDVLKGEDFNIPKILQPLSLELGYQSGKSEAGDQLAIPLSYDFGTLEKWGVKVPIIKYIGFRPAVDFSFGRIDQGEFKSNYSFGATFIEVKF